MAKTKISEYDSTAANNTDIDSINIAEGMAPSNVNNAIRELMAHLKDGLGAGTPVFLDQTNNRLGVGTDSPSSQLHLAGTSSTITLEDTDNASTNTIVSSFGQLSLRADTGSEQANSRIDFKVDGTEAMRIDSSGNVGIGQTSPEGLFHVETTQGAVIVNEGSSTSRYTTHIEVTDTGMDFHAKSNSRGFVFNTGSSKTQRMLIDSTGNIGLGGVTSPAVGFGVTGMIDTNGAYFARGQIGAHQTNAAVLQYGGNLAELRAYGATSGSGQIRFMTGGGGGAADSEAVRIDELGKMAVGNNDPIARLEVAHAANLTEAEPHFRIGGAGYSGYHFLDGTAYYIGQNSAIRQVRIYSGAETAGVALTNGATSWATFSDERLKYDVENIENAVETLSGLRTVKYRLNNVDAPDAKKKLGVIAQDLEGVLDEVVDTTMLNDDDTEYMSVRYTELIPVLIKAIQELSSKNDALETQNTTQATQIADLITRVEALEGA